MEIKSLNCRNNIGANQPFGAGLSLRYVESAGKSAVRKLSDIEAAKLLEQAEKIGAGSDIIDLKLDLTPKSGFGKQAIKGEASYRIGTNGGEENLFQTASEVSGLSFFECCSEFLTNLSQRV